MTSRLASRICCASAKFLDAAGLALAFAALLTMGAATPLVAKNGAFKETGHGSPSRGPERRTDLPRGSCAQCHEQHPSHTPGVKRNGKALFMQNDNELCFSCHTTRSEDGVFPGSSEWLRSTHATASAMVRPSTTGGSIDEVNRCINCHEPHGNRDNLGVIPALLAEREPELCLACHDGSRAPDIRNELTKSYTHPMENRGKHEPHEGSDAGRFNGMTLGTRHADCADCHNVHQVRSDPVPPSAPEASNRLAGVSRVEVANGGAGSLPNYRFIAAGDPGTALEYQVCFKCHSSFAKQPVGQTDLARATNPANPSFHPIQAEGRNPGISAAAFTNGWSAQSQVSCTNCHSTDERGMRGPHGSSYRYLLKKEAIVGSDPQPLRQDNLCFDCHAYAVYGDAAATEFQLVASRFNGPSGGHASHVGRERIPCYACHETHGSIRYPSLIATRRGITSFTQTPGGGTCNTTCHGARSYSINYPR